MGPRHAEAHRGRHLLPAMASLAGEVLDLVHDRTVDGRARPGVRTDGTRGLGGIWERSGGRKGKRVTRNKKAPGLCACGETDGAARRQLQAAGI